MDRIITRLGLTEDDPELLHDRRGTTVYKIGATALKITSGLMAAREGEILHLLGNQTYRAHGWDDERSWLTLRWINGTGLWNALEHAHRGEDSTATRHHMLVMTADAARELADLHAAGWVHSDLQPDHIIFDGDHTHLIDLACAQGPTPTYRSTSTAAASPTPPPPRSPTSSSALTTTSRPPPRPTYGPWARRCGGLGPARRPSPTPNRAPGGQRC